MNDMDQYDMICQNCGEKFDKNQHNPRMLPTCGHTICQDCLGKLLGSTQQQFYCLECQAKYETTLDISQFPKNYALLRMLEKYQNMRTHYSEKPGESDSKNTAKLNIQQQDNELINSKDIISQNENNDYKLCDVHKKIKDIVCVECRKSICASCALFTEHYNHQVRSQEDVLCEISQRAQILLVLFEKVQERQNVIQECQNQKVLNQNLQKHLQESEETVKQKFEKFRQLINQQETNILNDLKEQYQKLEQFYQKWIIDSANEILNQAETWKQRTQNILMALQQESDQKQEPSLELMSYQSNNKDIARQNDICMHGEQILESMDIAYTNQKKQIEQIKFENINVNFIENPEQIFQNLCKISKQIDNEFVHMLFSNNDASDQQDYMTSELMKVRKSVEFFNGILEKKKINTQKEPIYQGQLGQKDNRDSQIFNKSYQQEQHREQECALLVSQFDLNNESLNDSLLLTHKANYGPENSLDIIELQDTNRSKKNSQILQNLTDHIKQDNMIQSNNFLQIPKTDHILQIQVKNPLSKSTFMDLENIQEEDQQIDEKYTKMRAKDEIQEKMFLKKILEKIKKNKKIEDKIKKILQKLAEDQSEQADLTCADLGDDGMSIICDILQRTTKLKTLKLVRNKITDTGCFLLLDTLMQNQTLVSLNLASNRITIKVFDKLDEFVKVNKSLTDLYLNQNIINLQSIKKKIADYKNNNNLTVHMQ